MVEESQSMKDACKIMLEPLTNTGRIRTGFGTSLLEEARTAGRGEGNSISVHAEDACVGA